MVGLFCAKDGEGNNAIDKFVLIGDYKQLPAVVLQTEKQSAVTDLLLQEIGLQNCRNSLFERLYCRNTNSDIVFVMTRQGRMHKQVSGFSNEMFYGGELKPLLARQKKALSFSVYDEESKLFSLLATNRTAFISVEQEKKILSDKVNRAEARLIAQMVIAVKTLYFTRLGLGKEYVRGLARGLSMCRGPGRVRFSEHPKGNYLRIQLQLWKNCWLRLKG
jgi:hypothetical protein